MTHAEVLVVGAGPAGIAAATVAAENGRQVIVLDDNPEPGGQIWRDEIRANKRDAERHRAFERLAHSGVTVLGNHRVFNANAAGTVQAIREDGRGAAAIHFRYEQLILATGARERFLPFPGWTLPGVFGAGGLQALVKGGFQIAGKRIVVAGTGPLLLAVAAYLKTCGATIVAVAEQAELAQLTSFAASLLSQPAKIRQGLQYRAALGFTPYRTNCWPVAALSGEHDANLRAVKLTDGKRIWEESCDLLACGFHLVPNTELAVLLGCEFREDFVHVDAQHRTSHPHIFCVGEPTGIAGLEAALVQGEIAGLVCAGKSAASLERPAAAERVFATRLEKAFALRPELRSVATPETIVCRCEDVTFGTLRSHTSWTDAKLQTRCGMGPCQGRICGPAVETLLGWKRVSVRPPIFPVPLDAFCSNNEELNLLQEKR